MFRTKLVGYNRPNELYDPLVHSETIGQIFGAVTFISGKGAQLNTQTVLHPLSAGEYAHERRIFGAGRRTRAGRGRIQVQDLFDAVRDRQPHRQLVHVERPVPRRDRRQSGQQHLVQGAVRQFRRQSKIRAELRQTGSVRLLDPSRAYFWKWTWGSEVRLLVQEGIGGANRLQLRRRHGGRPTLRRRTTRISAQTPQAGAVEEGSRPGAVIRQVWISDKPRPDTLGNALGLTRGRQHAGDERCSDGFHDWCWRWSP